MDLAWDNFLLYIDYNVIIGGIYNFFVIFCNCKIAVQTPGERLPDFGAAGRFDSFRIVKRRTSCEGIARAAPPPREAVKDKGGDFFAGRAVAPGGAAVCLAVPRWR